jgi:hypothetical protein
MAAGGIVGYQPVPGQPNALNFQAADGRSFLAFGPEAMAMKQRIDASPPPMVAGPGGGEYGPPPPPQGYEDPNAGMSVAGPPPPPVSAPPGPGAPQAPGQVGAPSPVDPSRLGEYLTQKVYVPGSKGVSREQLLQKATQGVATPKSATMGVEGGFDPSQAYLDNQAELSVDERLLNQGVADAASARAAEEAELFRKQLAANAAKEAAAAKHAELMTAGVKRQEAALMNARQAFASAKVDPERLFNSGPHSGLKSIGSILIAGLGAYSAALGKIPNYAQNLLDNAVNNDIRAQEAAIRVKGESAQNALQDLMRVTGDMETAKSALRVVQLDQAQRQLGALAADSKSKQIQEAAAQWDIDHQKKLNEAMEDYRQKSIGKVSQQVQQEVLYPKAGSAGGYRAPTLAEQSQRVGIAKAVQGIASDQVGMANTEADTALKRANAGKVAAEAAKGPDLPDDKEFKKAATGIANHKAQIENVARKYGYEVKDGKIVPGKDAGFPTRLNVSGSAGLDTDLTALGVTFSSIANNDAELGEAAKAKLTPSPTEMDSTIIQKLQAQLDYVGAKEGAIKGTADPRLVSEMEKRKSGRGAAIRAQAEGSGGASGAPAFQEE